MMQVTTLQRMSAEDRREDVLRAAAAAFADGGYQGTTTQDVAERAGISQPYIFRLFSSKKELFVAVVEECFKKTAATFAKAAEGWTGDEALLAMGKAYTDLIRDPVNLLVVMHGLTAAANDPEIRAVAQRGMRTVWEIGAAASGAAGEDLRAWLARG